jgi:poly-gamma-glutamate capsule biosynthesis protein CapA/YwtB (metallophosphatase superfamily)
VVAHGPHRLRRIEVYRGKPIFYSLGNFSFMLPPMQPMPVDEFREFGLDPATTADAEPLERRLKKSFDSHIGYESVLPV